MIQGIGIGIGIPDEEAVELPGGQGIAAGKYEEHAGGGIILKDIQAIREERLQKPDLLFAGTQKRVQGGLLLLQEVLQQTVHHRLLFIDRGPALLHIVFQNDFPVFHQPAHHSSGVLLQGASRPADHQGADGYDALDQHNGNQRN